MDIQPRKDKKINFQGAGVKVKEILTAFISQKLKDDFELLSKGKFEDRKLYSFIERALRDLKETPTAGAKIPKNLWPREYVQKYSITNLWKYDLPNAWRLIYTIDTEEIRILSIILEWFDHKEYEKRFNY